MKVGPAISGPGMSLVKALRFAPGDQVAGGAELVDFEGVE